MKRAILPLILLSTFCSSTFSAEATKIKALDRMTYTINPTATLVGPVFRDKDSEADKTKYVSTLVSSIIKEADKKAQKYLEAGDTQAYYAFLVLGLTVPLHEGLYVHFRSVDEPVCNVDANNGNLVLKSGESNAAIFKQYLKDINNPYFPNCEEMDTSKGVNQMIRGGDGTDLSIMQVSIRWHFDDFLAKKKYESVSETLAYGFRHLMNGFNEVYRNVADYECLSTKKNFLSKRKINYINLVKGIWGGKYNSGNLEQTCRFADVTSPYVKHDIGFERNLNKILDFDGSISPDLIGELKLDKATSEAVKEIVANLKNDKNERKAISKILE